MAETGLVVTRKVGQAIVIDHGKIVIRITKLSMGAVQLRLSAPRAVAIHREEVHQKIQAEGTA